MFKQISAILLRLKTT